MPTGGVAEISQQLLEASCAILPSAESEVSDRTGTGWLVMDPGFLLTAGHVLQELPSRTDPAVEIGRGSTVHVQFLGEPTRPATVVFGPHVDVALGEDVAVLQLQEESERSPLPILLINDRVAGDVLVAGYGEDITSSLSVGTGTDIRTHHRDNRRERLLWQYTSKQLAFGGYSGAAVYSIASNGVVGIQIESSPASEQVLAMPMNRIAQLWREVSTVARDPGRHCVVLTDGDTAAPLYEQVIRPVLDDLNLEMHLSSLGNDGDDMVNLVQAAIVVADSTSHSPEVTRQLTMAQGLGTPDVVVTTQPEPDDRISRSLLLDLRKPVEARSQLRNKLLSELQNFSAAGDYSLANPMTAFFGAPLTQLSAAHGLASGYFDNFVSPVGSALVRAGVPRSGVVVKVKVNNKVKKLTRKQRADLTLKIVLPETLDSASDTGIVEQLNGSEAIHDAVVESRLLSRPRTLKAMRRADGSYVLFDLFPTTLNAIRTSIESRPTSPSGRVRAIIERKEIALFSSVLTRRIRGSDSIVTNPGEPCMRDKCFVVPYEVFEAERLDAERSLTEGHSSEARPAATQRT